MECKNVLLEQFFLNPMRKFGVRELSRIVHLDTKTIMKYLKDFIKKELVIKRKIKGKYNCYEANRLSHIFRHEKSEILVKKIFENGLVDFLEKKLSPKVIVLFGSVQKGTYHKDSDVDLFVQADYNRLDLRKFKKQIGFEVNLFFEKDIKKLSKGLKENIYNGLVLTGKLKILA